MDSRQTPALVIQVMDHGEADKIVTFYCPKLGKLAGIAKGAKRSKKRFLNRLEPFSLLQLDYTPSRSSNLVQIQEAELLNPFPILRSIYERYAAATLLCELVLFWTREGDGDPHLFDLLVWALTSLGNDVPWADTIILFQVKLFSLLGYRPHLDGCQGCGKLDASQAPYRFSLSQGGLTCNHCNREAGSTTLPLALSTANLLRLAQDLPSSKLSRLRFSKTSAQEAMDFLKRYGTFLLQRDIQSWAHLAPL